MNSSDSLPPLDTTEEIDKYEAFSETKTINFKGCSHLNTKLEPQSLKCMDCSAVWFGTRLHELQEMLSK